MEYNDIYDKDFGLTGRVHLRGTPGARGNTAWWCACMFTTDRAVFC